MEKTVIFLTLFFISKTKPTPVSLYSADDDIDILDVTNFKNKVVNSTSAWLVEFYASWCGDCQRFAPKWKNFAGEIVDWSDMVKVGAVECSDEMNTPLCREMGIMKYPTVKYFHENYDLRGDDRGVDLVHDDEAADTSVKQRVIECLLKEVSEGRGAVYPNLLPYDHQDLRHLFDDEADDVEFVVLVLKDRDHLGVELALNLHKIASVAVRYSLANNTALSANFNIKNTTLIIVDKTNNSLIYTKATTNDEIQSTVRDFLDSKGIKWKQTPVKEKTNDIPLDRLPSTLLRQHVKKMGDVIFQADLEAALRYSLQQEVSATDVIKGEQLEALNGYLSLINKYFPFGYKSLSLINKLINLTSNANDVRGSEIQRLVTKAEEDHVFSSPRRFIGCLGSSSSFRGYPCSLWHLYHYLTVNFADSNVNNGDVNPRESLDVVYAYVKNFFGCKQCSLHFQEMVVKRNMAKVSSLEDSILWLWESHNVVNERLKEDETEDPEYPKRQFPVKENCPECYDEDGSWRRNQVLKYLRRMYGRFNIRYIGSDTSIVFPGLD